MSAAIRIMRAPKIPLLGSLLVCGALVLSTWLADWATPRLLGVEDARKHSAQDEQRGREWPRDHAARLHCTSVSCTMRTQGVPCAVVP